MCGIFGLLDPHFFLITPIKILCLRLKHLYMYLINTTPYVKLNIHMIQVNKIQAKV